MEDGTPAGLSVGIADADDAPSSSSAASTRKRKSDVLRDAKPKKKKKAKVSRPARLGYTVEQGEDMLLIISNTNQYDNIWRPNTKGRKKKKILKGKAKVIPAKKKNTVLPKGKATKKPLIKKGELEPTLQHHQEEGFDSWGQSLPVEVLVNIFKMVVHQDGAVPFLCRVAKVCHLWNAAAASPALWRSVSVGYCWLEPGKTHLPKTVLKIRNTVSWLAQNRFSQLRDFSLNHWKNNVDHVVEVLSQSCPHLRSLKLSYCTGVTEKAFQSLSGSCRSLDRINVQYSEIQVEGLVTFLESYGSQLRQILFTHGPRNDRLLTAISRGCCPELQLLEINTKLDSGYCQLPICIQALQNGCPKLQTFRMLNVIPMPKMTRNGSGSTSGFPLLEELCMATTAVSFMTDQDLTKIVYDSPKLRVLDLRGCSRITAAGLSSLPCEELECLYWGLYFSSNVTVSLSKKGIHLLTQKWSGTLQELDLANQLFSEEDMEIAMGHLAQRTGENPLRSLNLSGTKVTTPALRLVIGQSTALNYLNLSSCRYLPRGLKKLYRGQEEIHQLLDKLE
ncbi:LOW QUALITY PROTEIN: F-box/LRR-repeat protein 6 [Oncorhynchus masou masou]|uniref:LOW QUALITY PROTEIN: F-box/LRR-repeat protein 6 n=1 Tax=Oncorhynchus masou masou TaxID=90313 RepID=UPI0031839CCD